MKKKIKDIVYLSGKITDSNPKKQKENLARFFVKEAELRTVWKDVFNPATLEKEENTPWEYYLARDLLWIVENKPDMYFMEDFESSKGAKLEKQFAKLLGLNLYYEKEPQSFKK